LENYYLPGELKAPLHKFVDYYNHERYHESLKNLAGQMCFMTVARKY
jgi:putative transposase